MQNKPLVSVICPLWNRREFMPSALQCFQSQDWPNAELIVADNSDEGQTVEDLVQGVDRVVYCRVAGDRRTTGAMRNIACEAARGDILIHADSDDWFAPNRITDQVTRLLETKAQMTGYRSFAFADDSTRRAWRYAGPMRGFVAGTSQCYLRSYWVHAKGFADRSVGEDSDFTRRCQVVSVASGVNMCVARVHSQNTADPQRALYERDWKGERGDVFREIPYSGLADIGYPVL